MISSTATMKNRKYRMFWNSDGIAVILMSSSLMLKNPAVVIAIANIVNGIIFARSFARSSLMYDVARTDATRAAEIRRAVSVSIPLDNNRIRIAKTVNQKKVRIGSRIIYSIM